MSSPHTAELIGTKCDQRIDTLLGHWLYCRRCITESPDGLVLTDCTRDHSYWFEILAIGLDVDCPLDWPKSLLKEREEPRWIRNGYLVHDFVLLPRDHPWGIMLSPYAIDERFVHERVPIISTSECDIPEVEFVNEWNC